MNNYVSFRHVVFAATSSATVSLSRAIRPRERRWSPFH